MSSDIDMPRTVEKERKDIIQPEHIRILFDKNVDDWYINAYRLAVILGMRRGEIAGLQWSDINDGVLSVNRMLRGDGIITEGKTKNARRTIKLPEQASQVLLLQAEKLNSNGILREWVFHRLMELPDQTASIKRGSGSANYMGSRKMWTSTAYAGR